MVKVELVGVHSVKKRLADGSVKTYYYAWRGGPAIKFDPAKERRKFTEEYLRLTRERDDAPYQGCMAEIIRGYLKSPHYRDLKPSTREGYDFAIRAIESEFYDMTAKQISAPGTRSIFLQWRDEMAETHKRKADLYMSVLQRVLWYALDREMIEKHPLERVTKVNDGTRRDIIWSDDDIATFKAKAREPLVRALLLAAWTGQRQGDLLALTWSAYDGHAIRLRQSKTGAHVAVKVSAELKRILDSAKAVNAKQETPAATILTNRSGQPWGSGFKSSWRKAMAAAGIEGRTFHDLRGTFVTLAYRNGASIREIAEITGHTEKDAETIIRKHYLVSSAAVEKIESRTLTVNQGEFSKLASGDNE
ncbi:tyrosine-type recombinase/integrase [Nitratireductor sp. CH_MIT9313-5]|uniref:tyrosine-type recombinase/integrase n=1 Tax=Nitratireductor sp. CH_MIT9313-5 TaxID=3107764 RepID=UPI00300821CF